ncbi:uncharacterized protein BO80DRAFT_274253 [Aspergillus ibericus CBS 121593]|uniref:Uncharacterized protein n=1 Tax=Aspergillus ibericus CBS 121593 TaxID=1448316 RepID=A0A395HAI1_9EURO|nr:hypothetical protein BO80DRAFT_274253 [Aspergillus ibericus CBS 121593]RAL03928.1 hypothetical protein BO80DRAFT_274253 [Aspergillus ibericus CBS 121593]
MARTIVLDGDFAMRQPRRYLTKGITRHHQPLFASPDLLGRDPLPRYHRHSRCNRLIECCPGAISSPASTSVILARAEFMYLSSLSRLPSCHWPAAVTQCQVHDANPRGNRVERVLGTPAAMWTSVIDTTSIAY